MDAERLAELDRTPRPVGLWEAWEDDPWSPKWEDVVVSGRFL